MTTLLLTALLAGIGAALLITATHLLLWRKPWRLTRVQAYAVGTAEIGIVLTIWALVVGHPESVIGFWSVAGCAGAADVISWWFRRRLARVVDAATEDGFQRGRIVGLDVPALPDLDGDAEAEADDDD